MMEDTFECWFYKGNNQRRKCKKGKLQFNHDVGVRFVVNEKSGGFRSIFGLQRKQRRIFAIPIQDLLKVTRCRSRKNTLVLYTRGSTRMMELTAPSMAVMTKWEVTLRDSIRKRDQGGERTTVEDIRKLIAKDKVGEEHEAFMRETSKYKAGYVRVEMCAKGENLDLTERPWGVRSLLIHTGRGEITMTPLVLENESKKKKKLKTIVHSLQDTDVVAIDPRTGQIMKNNVKIDMDTSLVVAILRTWSSSPATPTNIPEKPRRPTRRRSSLFQRLTSFSFGQDRSIDDMSLPSPTEKKNIVFLSCPHRRLPISSRPSDVVVKTEMGYKKDPFPLASILKSMSFSGSTLSKPLTDYVRYVEKMSVSPPSSPRRRSVSPRHRRASTFEISKRQIETLPKFTYFLAVSIWMPVWEDEHAAHVSHSCAQAVRSHEIYTALNQTHTHFIFEHTQIHDEENMDIKIQDDSDELNGQPPPKLIDVSQKSIESQKPPICLGHWSVSYLDKKMNASSTCETLRVRGVRAWSSRISPSHSFTKMSILSLVSFVYHRFISQENHSNSNAQMHTLNDYENSDRARTQVLITSGWLVFCREGEIFRRTFLFSSS